MELWEVCAEPLRLELPGERESAVVEASVGVGLQGEQEDGTTVVGGVRALRNK